MVYTAPVVLMLGGEWQQGGTPFDLVRLTNIVVRVPAGLPDEPELDRAGRTSLRNVVERRCAEVGFLVPDVIDDSALDRLLDASGGVLRTLIYLVNHAIRQARRSGRDRIGDPEAEAAIGEAAQEFTIGLDQAKLDEIASVNATHMPSGTELSRRMLLSNLILPYRNGRTWFAPAPLAARESE